MKTKLFLLATVLFVSSLETKAVDFFPVNGAENVNVDTHLTLTFDDKVSAGNKGFIKVYDAKTGKMVDKIDMSIPAGPVKGAPKNPNAQYTPVPYVYKNQHVTNRNTVAGTPSGVNKWDKSRYQLTIIGGFSDGFHFYPVMCHDNKATIYLHNNMLEYGHEYYVTIDNGVIDGFEGVKGKRAWRFKTKANAPTVDQRLLIVSADGSGDFSTLQGAMDFIPEFNTDKNNHYKVFVKNGDYEELVYFRNKNYVTIEGESRDGVLVHYPNNEVFNPHPIDVKTNELPGTFPSRRAAVAADNCRNMVFKNITFKTDRYGQAEGFLLNGENNFAENVKVVGSGDALQVNGSTYWLNCIVDGGGDMILGRGPSFFNHCSFSSDGAFMWIRNTEKNHGNVFVDCSFTAKGKGAVIARLPSNKGKNYPHAESVLLNCTLNGIPSEGWGPIGEDAKTATLLEFNSHDAEGNPIDVSKRHEYVRQLDALKDAETIAKYHDYRFVLGWK